MTGDYYFTNIQTSASSNGLVRHAGMQKVTTGTSFVNVTRKVTGFGAGSNQEMTTVYQGLHI